MADGLDFDELVTRYYGPLYQFAFSLSRDEADSCDLVQQTFCVWAAKGHQLRDATKVKTWLFTTLHREFLGIRRKQTRFPHLELENAADELPTIPPATVDRLDTAQLLAALARLDEVYQAPVALFYLQDCSYNEIAEILGVPLGTVKSRLARGLARLHEFLTGEKIETVRSSGNMNLDEAKIILLACRPGVADAEDPQVAEALALAKRDPGLARWLEQHFTRQKMMQAKFRQIHVPAGLKEQIISEQAASERVKPWLRNLVLVGGAVAVAVLVVFLLPFHLPQPMDEATLEVYQNQMAGVALRGYAMDLSTNDQSQIRDYLAQNRAPADYHLPAALQQATAIGCAVETWQATKVSLICFRTGRPLPPGQQNDLWLFVVDRAAVKDMDIPAVPQIANVNRLVTAAWTEGGKVYFLGTTSDAETLKHYL